MILPILEQLSVIKKHLDILCYSTNWFISKAAAAAVSAVQLPTEWFTAT